MQGKILIVDAIATNRIVLKVKLASAFYKVLQAASVTEAISMVALEQPDLVITAFALPDGDAAGLCRAMRDQPASEHTPIMAIGALSNKDLRVTTLEAGVQDVMLKPLNDTLLLGRVRSLIRAQNAAAEWQMRDDTTRALGMAEPSSPFTPLQLADKGPAGYVTVISTEPARLHSWLHRLRPMLACQLAMADPGDALGGPDSLTTPDAYVLVLPASPKLAADTLRLISALRANSSTRHAGLLVLQTAGDPALAANALDLGADDLMTDGFEEKELALRLKALLRRKRMADQLRKTVRTGLRAAMFDPLTGLHNRRYAMPHLSRIAEHSAANARPFAVMLADMDHFKRINDIYGHASGDAVLVETARRLRSNLRSVDMVARLGGEEFLIVMSGTAMDDARETAREICQHIGGTPFDIPGSDTAVSATISIGLAMGGLTCDSANHKGRDADALLDLADKALYAAKMKGRNRVTLSRPAA
ncbi:diguanylate cyclase response regulator [Sulfitobacter sp. SK012]|uniref:diguanylate cyclase n=1 Tax=Sulfitobacter sp. SK012 TaxID=1389005 RepID=UPI000E0A80F4|nr:diguanylate cyclase [Sulfitobacter sp. SK012]AXI45911.1 diguanylate cyclase response regulator [Sulfitobacter sp. SK012]